METTDKTSQLTIIINQLVSLKRNVIHYQKQLLTCIFTSIIISKKKSFPNGHMDTAPISIGKSWGTKLRTNIKVNRNQTYHEKTITANAYSMNIL
jgi:hypothetical protein